MKYNVQKCLENVREQLLKIKNSNELSKVDQIIEDLCIFSKQYTNNNLYSNMESKVEYMNMILEVKNAILREQFVLIQILVQRLFNVDVGLKFLEERVQSIIDLNKSINLLNNM